MLTMPEDDNAPCATIIVPMTTVANDDGSVGDKLVVASGAETIMQVVGGIAPDDDDDDDDADMSLGSDGKEYVDPVDHMSCLENPMSLTADGLMLPPEGAENDGQIVASQSSCDGSSADELPRVTLVTDLCNGAITMETGDQVLMSPSDLNASIDGSMVRHADGSIALMNATGVAPPLLLMAEQLSAAGVTLPDSAALQNMLATHGTATFTGSNGETIQIITVNHPDQDGSEPPDGVIDIINLAGPVMHDGSILMPPPQIIHNLPPGCPTWAARLKDCEQIGDSFRGWVETEVELDLVLTFHKQQTQSFWGTRQSPSPAKQSTRLMWKSQYVPFDGMPFINAGSRAVVMECQYGPRRKGSHLKRQAIAIHKPSFCFTQTCPARIYVKKVRKFPEFAVDLNMDKKSLKLAMDKSFHMLKGKTNLERMGQERFYVQLPTEKAHEFHSESSNNHLPPQSCNERLHPRIVQKIRDLVAAGETRLYVIRKNLRRFVEKELFGNIDQMPEKHNLSFYPTVNDLQNNIHQALQDIENGLLPVTAQMVNMEVVTTSDCGSDSQELPPGLWQSVSDDQPHAETVTVTLTQSPGEDGQHVISRVETHLSDGTTQVSTSLTPETIRLLAKLHPNIFPAGSLLQFRDGSTQPVPVGGHNIVLDPSALQTSDLGDMSDTKDDIHAAEDQPLVTVPSDMIAVPQSIVLNAGMTDSMVHADLGKVIMQVPFGLQTNGVLCGGNIPTAVYQHHQMEPHEMVDDGDMMSKQLDVDCASSSMNTAFSADQCIKLEENGEGRGDSINVTMTHDHDVDNINEAMTHAHDVDNINEAMTHDHADIHNDDDVS